MHKALVEFLGTFFLVLVVGLTATVPEARGLAPLAIGAILMVMVYAGGPISGGHYNPAVTLAAWLRGACAIEDALRYWVAQALGAVVAAGLVGVCVQGGDLNPLELSVLPALLIEGLFTFALAFVVLSVTTSKRSKGNSYFGAAIGGTVLAAAIAGGGISGGAFNPAVAVGLTLMGLSLASHLWMFLVADFAGGALAALVFRLTHPDE